MYSMKRGVEFSSFHFRNLWSGLVGERRALLGLHTLNVRRKDGMRIGLLHLLWTELSAAENSSPIPQARLWMQSILPHDERRQSASDQKYSPACRADIKRN
jgi:hypothetical protein